MNPAALSPREIATVLAALRYYQRDVEADGPAFLFGDIATDCGAHTPMTTAEIETLAEKINAPDAAATPASETPAFDGLPREEQLTVAMEIWEVFTDAMASADHALHSDIEEARKTFGFAELREIATAFAAPAWQGFMDRDIDRFDDSFDWVWCPAFLTDCVAWSDGGRPTLRSDWKSRAAEISDGRHGEGEGA